MESIELLKQRCTGHYQGYELQTINKTSWSEKNMTSLWGSAVKQLQRIPAKIGYFFDKSKISKVWKTKYEADPRDNWYFILTTDGTMFEAHY